MKALFASSLAFLLVACGGNVDSGNTAPVGDDAGTDTGSTPVEEDTGAPAEDAGPILDHGAPSTTYPAFPADLPMLKNQGAGGLTAPSLVTVTFPGDVNATSYETFGDKIGATEYWKAITAEYGVGAAVGGGHVRETTAWPTTIADFEVDAWINDHATNYAKYGWPAPTNQTIYVIYVPQATSLTMKGSDACKQGVGGYHTSTVVGTDRKSTRLNSSHSRASRMPSSA